jgi:hypothetical protein
MTAPRRRLLALVVLIVSVGLANSPADARPPRQHFEFRVTTVPDGRRVGTFRYERHLTTPTLDAPAGWLDGDRVAYRCAYAFLEYRGHLVGRATFTRIDPPDGDPYVRLNDAYMREGVRNYDGTLTRNTSSSSSCPAPSRSYDRLAGDPGPRPAVRFQHGPHTIDVRDFGDSSDVGRVGAGHDFGIVLVTADRVEIVAYQDGVPALAIYYERLLGDSIIPGTMHPVTLEMTEG